MKMNEGDFNCDLIKTYDLEPYLLSRASAAA